MTEALPEIPLPRLLDRAGRFLGLLHPSRLTLTLSLTPLSRAEMVLEEEEAREVRVGEMAELFSARGSEGVFRVTRVRTEVDGRVKRTVTLEHALVTLADRVLFGYTELSGMTLREVVSRLLEGQDRWRVGEVEADTRFSYAFENENVLTALLSLTAPMEEDMAFETDMTGTPWLLHVRKLPSRADCEIRRSRNLIRAEITRDMEGMVTRLYPLGYGEGADQLTVKAVNGGVPYLEAETAGDFGVMEAVSTESTVSDAATLLAAAKRTLRGACRPQLSLRVSALALFPVTGEALDRFSPGSVCRLAFPEAGDAQEARILSLCWQDVYRRPLEVDMEMASGTELTGDLLSRLSRRASVSELYAQGAASAYAVHFGDNADAEHPAVLRFYVDEEAIHVNQVTCRFVILAFRGYTRGESGGGKGKIAVDGCEVTAQVPETTLTTGYNQSSALEGRHVHTVQTSAQTVRVRLLASSLGAALDVGAHTHPTAFGIYESGGGGSVRVEVDGKPVAGEFGSEGEFDAVPCLERDAQGRIRRGAWHTVAFVPAGPVRVEADVHVRTFIRSLTGAGV